MQDCPTEILITIFEFLNPIQQATCRKVCRRWNEIVDKLSESESHWRKHCEIDFKDVYKTAYTTRTPGLSNRNLYRSLCLWSKLHNSFETCTEFTADSYDEEDILGFQLLRHGQIGIHIKTAILYFDITSIRPSSRPKISGNYVRYVENDHTVVLLGLTMHLYVTRKVLTSESCKKETSFPSVKNFLLTDENLYYTTATDDIYVCSLINDELLSSYVSHLESSIMCLGYENGYLHVLTYDRTIATFSGNELVYCRSLENKHMIWSTLKECHLLEHLDWKVYMHWMFVLKLAIPDGYRDINVVKTYRDIVFVGTRLGDFYIYRSSVTNTGFDLFKLKIVRQYNFRERNSPDFTDSLIILIDVLEGEDSHKVLVSMPKKIVVLHFTHNFKKKAPQLNFDEEQPSSSSSSLSSLY